MSVTAITTATSAVFAPNSTSALDIYYVASGATPPTFTLASPSPTTVGPAVSLGTVAPGTSGHPLSVNLVRDTTFSSGSSIALSGANVMYTPGTISGGNVGLDAIVFEIVDGTDASHSVFSNTVFLATPPVPVFTPASSPSTSGGTVIIGTVTPGTPGDTLTITLNSDSVFPTGSSLALSGSNVEYTPGTIASSTSTTLGFTVNDTTNSTSITPTASVALSVPGVGPSIAAAVAGDTASGTTLTLPTLSAPANSVIVLLATVTFTTISGVSDTSGLTWTLRKSQNPGFYPVEEWWASTTTAIATDITFTTAALGNLLSAVAFAAIDCSSLSAPFDTNASLPAGGSSDPISISTSATNTLVFGAFRGATASSSAGAGYTLIAPSAMDLMTEYKVLTSTAASLAVTDGISGDAIAVVADALA